MSQLKISLYMTYVYSSLFNEMNIVSTQGGAHVATYTAF